jgi:hypothetical protein
VAVAHRAGEHGIAARHRTMPCYMLCDAMMCCAALCYAMLCYAMPCHAMPCYAMQCYAMLCYAMHAMLCYAWSRRAGRRPTERRARTRCDGREVEWRGLLTDRWGGPEHAPACCMQHPCARRSPHSRHTQ